MRSCRGGLLGALLAALSLDLVGVVDVSGDVVSLGGGVAVGNRMDVLSTQSLGLEASSVLFSPDTAESGLTLLPEGVAVRFRAWMDSRMCCGRGGGLAVDLGPAATLWGVDVLKEGNGGGTAIEFSGFIGPEILTMVFPLIPVFPE